ncbi:hypothetical protein Vretimale_17105 [Volvox reticuliferus]|uniref:RAP domain-containing protein n=1 Tax=Volvox reticuliferus TaxID=1737510 RepID=A0A8J4GVL7_9CHLO|nr:hypothetical protein Vretimale_17105 [Volvox reticuliferus]
MSARSSGRLWLQFGGSVSASTTSTTPPYQIADIASLFSFSVRYIDQIDLSLRQTLRPFSNCRRIHNDAAEPRHGIFEASPASPCCADAAIQPNPLALTLPRRSFPLRRDERAVFISNSIDCANSFDIDSSTSSGSSSNDATIPRDVTLHSHARHDEDSAAAAATLSAIASIGSGDTDALHIAPPCAQLSLATNIWLVRCPSVSMEAAYPSLPLFADAVCQQATTWHPVLISTAMNHAVKLKNAIDRQRLPLSEAGRASASVAAAYAAAPGGVAGSSGGAASSAGNTAEVMFHETLDRLYIAFLPHIPNIVDPRFVTNALWVCARTGRWDAPGGGDFAALLLQRLREDDGAMLEALDGVGHSILWRALSMSGRHRAAATAQGHGAASAPTTLAVEPVQVSPAAHVLAVDSFSAVQDQRPQEGSVNPAVDGSSKTGLAAAGMDVLELSANIIKKRLTQELTAGDKREPTLPDLCNLIRAASRLRYRRDVEFIEALLAGIVKSPGPFRPQDIADTLYGLGKLYGTVQDKECGTTLMVNGDSDEVASASTSATAASGCLPPEIAPRVRNLADLAVMTGLSKFSPQNLSILVHGLALLGLRLERQAIGQAALAAAVAGPETTSQVGLPSPSPPLSAQIPDGPSPDAQTHRTAPAVLSMAQAQPHPQQPQPQHLQQLQPPEGQPSGPDAAVTSDWTPNALSNAAWAFATIGYWDQSYYAAVVHAAMNGGCMAGGRREVNAPKASANLRLYFCANVRHATHIIISPEAKARSCDGGSLCLWTQPWALLLWSLATAGHQPPGEPLMQQLRAAVCEAPNRPGDTPTLGTMLWALGTLRHYDRRLVARISEFARPTAMIRRQVVDCLWALAAMPEGSMSRHMQFAAGLVQAANQQPVHEYTRPELVQLWHTHLELEAAATSGERSTVEPEELSAPPVGGGGCGNGGFTAGGGGFTDGTQSLGGIAISADMAKAPGSGAVLDAGAAVPKQIRAAQLARIAKLNPGLVEAAQEAVLEDRTSHSRLRSATDWQSAVFRCLRGLMSPSPYSTRLQQQHQQQPWMAQLSQYQPQAAHLDLGHEHGAGQVQQTVSGCWAAGEVRWRLLQDASAQGYESEGAGASSVASAAGGGGSSEGSRRAPPSSAEGPVEAGKANVAALPAEAAGGSIAPTARIDLIESISRISGKRAVNLQRTVTRCLNRGGESRGLSGMAAGEAQPRRQQQRQQGRGRGQGQQHREGKQQGEVEQQQESDGELEPRQRQRHGTGLHAGRTSSGNAAAVVASTAAFNGRGRLVNQDDRISAASRQDGGSGVDAETLQLLDVEQDWFVESLGLKVCARVRLSDGRQLALELEGPDSFFRNVSHSRRPHAALRVRQLGRVFGPENIRCVPHWEWAQLDGCVQAQRAYLSRLFRG